MLKIVPDTNILVSATIVEGNEYRLLEAAKRGKIKIILSLEILREFRDVISRAKFGFSSKQIEDVFKEVLDISEIIMPSIKLDIIKQDPPDNRILEAAIEGKVDYIVSGDKHLLNLREFRRIKIVQARDILGNIRELDF